MAKIRLNSWTRDKLRNFAASSVKAPKEEAARLEAYERALPFAICAVHKKFPSEDMETLKKYNCHYIDHCLLFTDGVRSGVAFNVKPTDTRVPLRPRYADCSNTMYMADAEDLRLFDEVKRLDSQLITAVENKLTAYRTLIQTAVYTEEVIEVWPAAQPIIEKFMRERGQTLIALSPDIKQFIAADNAGAQQAA